MTEDDAKTKWCPFVRSVPSTPIEQGYEINQHIGAHNRLAGSTPVGTCIGSACMAWRWSKLPPPIPASVDRAIIYGTPDQREEQQAKYRAQRPGFCGLAGAPQ